MSKSDAVDVVSTSELAESTDPNVQAFLAHAQSLTVEEPEAVQSRILANLLAADNAEAVLTAGGVTKAEDLIGIPLTVMGIRASNSDYEAGPDLYLHVDAKIIANGDTVTFATGARDVMFKLVRLDQLGAFPTDVVMKRASKPTKAGFYPIFLDRPDPVEESF